MWMTSAFCFSSENTQMFCTLCDHRKILLCGSVTEWGFWGSGEVNYHLLAVQLGCSGNKGPRLVPLGSEYNQREAERNVVHE